MKDDLISTAIVLLVLGFLVSGRANADDSSARVLTDVPPDSAPSERRLKSPVEEADEIAKSMPPLALERMLATQVVVDCSRQRTAAGQADGACICYGTVLAERAGDRDGLVHHAWLVLHGKARTGKPDDVALAEISAAAAKECDVGGNPLFATPWQGGQPSSCDGRDHLCIR